MELSVTIDRIIESWEMNRNKGMSTSKDGQKSK